MKTDFQALATKLIYEVFGSISQTLTIRRPIYINYDEETGSQIMSSDDYVVQAVIGPWIDKNQAAATSNAIRTDDLSAIISKEKLAIVPEMNFDIAITADGTEWAIVQSTMDEAEATLILRLSKGVED
jgi:hypothetical protein